MLLRRAGVWRLGPGKALRLAKGITEKLFSATQFCDKLPWDKHVRYSQHEQQSVPFLGHRCSTDLCSVILSIAYNGDQLRWLIFNGFSVLRHYVKISNVS